MTKNSGPTLPEDFQESLSAFTMDDASEIIRASLPSFDVRAQDARSIQRVVDLVRHIQTLEEEKGQDKWFTGKYSIDTLPKHAAFFAAGKDYPERLFMAGNRCHAAGTKVWMADGSEKNIEDVVVGDTVLAFDCTTENLVPTEVVDTFVGVADYVRSYHTPSSNRTIASTTDHPFLVRTQSGKLFQRKADDLRRWDKVVIPTKWEMTGQHPGFSEDVAKLIGLLVGDGYLAAKDGANKLTNNNEEILKFAERVARNELGLDVRRVNNGNYTDLYFPKMEKIKGKSALTFLLEKLNLLGKLSHEKEIPQDILLAPEGHVRAFVQGLLAADGHYREGRIDLYTTSLGLAQTFEKACLRLGVTTNRSVKCHDNPNHRDCYVVNISGDKNLLKVGDAFHKKIVLRKGVREKHGGNVSLRKGEMLPKQEIYCITVEHSDHLFVANGYVNSNTGKSLAGAFELSCHLTGNYPIWWVGHRFDGPIEAWAVGKDARAVRDTAQKELLGPIGEWGTGMIPAHALGKFFALQGTPQAIDVIQVRHKSGGWSRLGFKNYQQDIGSFMGTSRHCVLPSTEVLTKRGWVTDPQVGEEILSYEKGQYVWSKVNWVYRENHCGQMYRLESRNNFSIDVTPEHRWLVYNKWTGKTYTTLTKDLKTSEQLIVSAEAVKESQEEYDDAFVQLVGWLVTDGSLGNGNMYLTQSATYNPAKCKMIEDLLAPYGEDWYVRNYNYTTGDGIQNQYCIKGDLRKRLAAVVGSSKMLSAEFVNRLSTRQRHLLLEAVILGDGMYNKGGSWAITSNNKERIDGYQYLATLCGYRTSITNNGNNTFKLRSKTKISPRYDYTRVSVDSLNISTYDYDGEVYCPNTDEGMVVFRSDSTDVLLSGNCIWLDEECPLDIYNECNIRTATVNGIMLVTFTPLDGLTPMVVNFCKKADFLVGARPVVAVDVTDEEGTEEADFIVGNTTSKAVIQAGWDDAPWLSEDMKARLLEDTPIHLREARAKGTPAMGSGNVYPIPLEEVLVDVFAIPPSWPRMYALDVGWNRTAAVWAALDPATDTIYLYDEHYKGQALPVVHAHAINSRGAWVTGVIDPAARGRSQLDGKKLISEYKELGLILFPAKNELESGILNVTQRLASGKLKIFKTLVNLQKEYLLYRRDRNGRVVPENDHALDCVRYVCNNLNRMSSSAESLITGELAYAPTRYDI